MVHLASVKNDDEVFDPASRKIDSLSPIPDESEIYTNVYGSRFAAEHLPEHEMPEGEMPRQVAARMIRDELSLDGNPKLNLASFVTTYMEDEIEDIMTDSFSKNFIDYEEYPHSAEIQNRCVNMIARLFNCPTDPSGENAMGTSTIGSSEAIMLGTLAMKKRWQNKRKAEGKDWTRPNIVMNSAVQVCWEKAARYFDIEEKYVYCTETRFVIDPKQAVDLVDENTIGICAIIGTTYTGEYEDVKAINDLLVERGIDCPIHVDAASGGFVAPFIQPDLVWDFRLEKVVSINVSGHKYGLVYPGVGWALWRSPDFTLNFSKGASQVIGQYYQMIRLGKHGYRSIMVNLTRIADYMSDQLKQMGMIIMSQGKGKGLPLVAFRLPPNPDRVYDEFAVAHQLRERGWVVPAYTMAPHSEKLQMMRVVVREDFSMNRCDSLLIDVKLALQTLESMDQAMITKYKAHMRNHRSHPRHKQTHAQYQGEKHSLQGKHGKTHGVC
ncbi:Glutamate decarboxylase 4 [Penicillium cosmopolitanum]|uniref:Glutamate decarboxylase n=1 Tax=Penicillium cosmopolitanum TaxID=1131564 RepID=A0A9X0B7N4_9EURO|nr:Glutamate decarboxylase 4 [Penicillium cosmopolitanum]KAJ5391161.1 Glutamate decarboxylase 4 [Penicillium cosmopolitanum]